MFRIKGQPKKRTPTGEVIQESEKGIEHKRKCNSAKRDNIKNKISLEVNHQITIKLEMYPKKKENPELK